MFYNFLILALVLFTHLPLPPAGSVLPTVMSIFTLVSSLVSLLPSPGAPFPGDGKVCSSHFLVSILLQDLYLSPTLATSCQQLFSSALRLSSHPIGQGSVFHWSQVFITSNHKEKVKLVKNTQISIYQNESIKHAIQCFQTITQLMQN